MKLELKHLSAYLPYGLKLMSESENESLEPNIYELKSIDTALKMVNFGWGAAKELTQFKPILRPKSDLDKEIELNGKKFVPQDEFSILYGGGVPHVGRKLWLEMFIDNIKYSPIDTISFGVVEKLLEWHFDIYGLIDVGLAIDINKIHNS